MAALTSAPGHPQASGNLTPNALWSGKLIEQFYKNTVFGLIANTDHEEEIKGQGDTVKIRTSPRGKSRPYEKGQKLVIDRPSIDTVDLEINQARYFAVMQELVDSYQSDLDYIPDWIQSYALSLQVDIDGDVIQGIPTDAHANNQGNSAGKDSGDIALGATGSPVETTEANVINQIIDMGLVLDEQSVPDDDRFIVAPPWWIAKIKASDLKDASMTGDAESIIRRGAVGGYDRFTIFRSRNLLTQTDSGSTVTSVLFGQKSALTFAAQIEHMDDKPVNIPDEFGWVYRCLAVYGFKVVKPEALGRLYTVKGS
jgi:hypothetical protein